MEHLLTTNDFGKRTTLTGAKAIAVAIIRLILMEPGVNPLHPEEGVGLKSRFGRCTNDDLDDLKREIYMQLSVYLPEYSGIPINAEIKDAKLDIRINVDGEVYIFDDALNETNSIATLNSL